MHIRAAGLALVRRVGTRICDYETGRFLGRALLVPWRGKIHVIGLEATVRPVFLPQKRLTFWKQTLGFTTHLPPDFRSHLRPPGAASLAGQSEPASARTDGSADHNSRNRTR